MTDLAILAVGLGKQYRIGTRARYKTLRESITEFVRAPLRAAAKGKPDSDRAQGGLLWALRNVSLEVRQGQVIGVIGRNGAGKSTLLKVLAQITAPTEGYAEIRGRVGSLLEVGVGFHQELTGRENIYLNGALLGMRRAEIERKFDAIVAFAEVEKFLETPLKHYSSGMFVRLGFAVAAHLETEILFVDEVLSVGDAAFQEKCLGKMKDAGSAGRTVIFVSHNLLAVQALCQHALWLERGEVVAEGTPATVISHYLQHVRTAVQEVSYPDPANAPGNDVIRLHRASIRSLSDDGGSTITVRSPLRVEFEFWNRQAGMRLDCGLNLYNQYGVLVFCTVTADRQPRPAGLIRVSGQIPGDLLNVGVHRIEFLAVKGGTELVWNCEDLLAFEVTGSSELRNGDYEEWPGAVRPHIQWTTEVV